MRRWPWATWREAGSNARSTRPGTRRRAPGGTRCPRGVAFPGGVRRRRGTASPARARGAEPGVPLWCRDAACCESAVLPQPSLVPAMRRACGRWSCASSRVRAVTTVANASALRARLDLVSGVTAPVGQFQGDGQQAPQRGQLNSDARSPEPWRSAATGASFSRGCGTRHCGGADHRHTDFSTP